jgi:hypothetical protein
MATDLFEASLVAASVFAKQPNRDENGRDDEEDQERAADAVSSCRSYDGNHAVRLARRPMKAKPVGHSPMIARS